MQTYQKDIKISKAQMKCLDITGDAVRPEWNYTIRPRPRLVFSAEEVAAAATDDEDGYFGEDVAARYDESYSGLP